MSHGDHVESVRDVARVAVRFRRHRHHRAFPESMGRSFIRKYIQNMERRCSASVLTMRCSPKLDDGQFRDEQVDFLREKVGDGHVICGLSGGGFVCDSRICKRLSVINCTVYLDNGLRKGEREVVEQEFSDFDLTVVDASVEFLTALDGITDPEAKRKTIGGYSLRCSIEKPVDCPNLMEIYSGWRRVPCIQM